MHSARRPHDLLSIALRELHGLLARLGVGMAAGDPLRLALPALPPAEATRPTPDVLAAYAALYLHAELEEAGVLPTIEALAEQRHQVFLQDRATVERVERFASLARNYPNAAQRAQIFARLFGMGPEATRNLQSMALAGTPAFGSDDARLDFRQRLVRYATNIVRADLERARLGGAPGLASQAAWRAAGDDLRAMIAALPAGSLVQWAQRIHARLLQAFDILADSGLQRQLVANSPWQALQRLLPAESASRRDAAARRGAAGQALLRSLGAAGGAPDADAVQSAMLWLTASGLPVPGDTLTGGPVPMPRTAFSAERGA